MIRHIIFAAIGATGFGLITVMIFYGVGSAFGPFYDSEADQQRNLVIVAVIFLCAIVFGGVAGYRLSMRRR